MYYMTCCMQMQPNNKAKNRVKPKPKNKKKNPKAKWHQSQTRKTKCQKTKPEAKNQKPKAKCACKWEILVPKCSKNTMQKYHQNFELENAANSKENCPRLKNKKHLKNMSLKLNINSNKHWRYINLTETVVAISQVPTTTSSTMFLLHLFCTIPVPEQPLAFNDSR